MSDDQNSILPLILAEPTKLIRQIRVVSVLSNRSEVHGPWFLDTRDTRFRLVCLCFDYTRNETRPHVQHFVETGPPA